MRILHAFCLNYNIGDYALGIGEKNLFRNFMNVSSVGNTNLQGRYFDKYYIHEVVNKKYDLLVIGGGGIIHGAHWPNGWFWLIEQELIKQIKIPFIIFSAGNNYFENETIPQKAIDHLRETFKYSTYFSVRNDGSYERVKEQFGIDPFEIPDPGFHVNLNTEYQRKINQPYVILQVANDKIDHRFGNKENIVRFISSLRNVVKKLSLTYYVLLAPHVFDDIRLSNEIAQGISNCSVWDFGALAFDHSDIAVGYYKYAEFVIAMRGHGQILPIGFNVPVIALHNHPKHMGLMEKLSISEFCTTVDTPLLETKLLQQITTIETNKTDIVSKFKSINANLFSQSEKAFEIINQRINEK